MQLTTDKKARKEQPIARGFMDYFPNAIAEVAHVSYVGNQQHNPGQEMHWSRGKSDDHADCIARHLIERGTVDEDGVRHSAKAAWRALAMLQLELEADSKHPIEKYVHDVMAAENRAKAPAADVAYIKGVDVASPGYQFVGRQARDFKALVALGCPEKTAMPVIGGTTYAHVGNDNRRDCSSHPAEKYVYVAGPMRGYAEFNFPSFDRARDELVRQGYNVISPADMSRGEDITRDPHKEDSDMQLPYAIRDFWSLAFIRSLVSQPNEAEYQKAAPVSNAIALLPGWMNSTGASAEFFLARWLGLGVIGCDGKPYATTIAMHNFALAHAIAPVSEPDYTGDWDTSVIGMRGRGHYFHIAKKVVTLIAYRGDELPLADSTMDFEEARKCIVYGRWTRLTAAEIASYS